jgi:hypothetical protein
MFTQKWRFSKIITRKIKSELAKFQRFGSGAFIKFIVVWDQTQLRDQWNQTDA